MDNDLRKLELRYRISGMQSDLIALDRAREQSGLLPTVIVMPHPYEEGSLVATSMFPIRNVRITSVIMAHDGWWGIHHSIHDPIHTTAKHIGEHRSPHVTQSLPYPMVLTNYHARLERLKPDQHQLETAHAQIVEAYLEDRFRPMDRMGFAYDVEGVDWGELPPYPWQRPTDSLRHNPMHPRRQEALLLQLVHQYPRLSKIPWAQVAPEYKRAAEERLGQLAALDPTENKKYTPWLVRENIKKNLIWPDDAEVAEVTLPIFHRYKQRFEHQDINHYRFGALAAEASRYELPEGTRGERVEQGLNILTYYRMGRGFIDESEDLQDADMRLLHVTTPEAARRVARGTAWCVRNLEVAADYLASGRLLFIEMWVDDGDGNTGWMPYVLSHLGYRKRYGGEGPDWYQTAAEIMDIENRAFSLDPEIGRNRAGHETNATLPDRVQHLIRLLDFGFRPFVTDRIRIFGDAWDLRHWEQYEQHEKADYEYGPDDSGRIEDNADYAARLLVYVQVILQQRDPWIEEKLLELVAQPPQTRYGAASSSVLVDYALTIIKDRWMEAEPYIVAKRFLGGTASAQGEYVRGLLDLWRESDEDHKFRALAEDLKGYRENPYPTTMYHATPSRNRRRILSEGLKVGQPYNMTEGGAWATEHYGTNPIFLSDANWITHPEDFEPESYDLFEIRVDGLPLVADLPSLVDRGGMTEDIWMWWKRDLPETLEDVHDPDWGIDMERLVTPGTPEALAAIATTKTAACISDIPPDRIRFIGKAYR